MSLIDLTAEEILAARDPRRVLGKDLAHGFRLLAKKWHPDVNKHPKAGEVMAKLHELRDVGEGKKVREVVIPGGKLEWGFDRVTLTSMNTPGATAEAVRVMKLLRGKNVALEKRVYEPVAATDDSYTLSIAEQEVPLVDIIAKYPNGVPPVHVAWMASRLYELVAHMYSWAEYGHLGLLPETLLVQLEPHGVIALDWRFAIPLNKRITAIPGALRHLVPADKQSQSLIDLKAINELMIHLLGDPSGIGNKLLLRSDIDRKFLDWFRAEPMANPVEYYTAYRKRLTDVFGSPKYHRLTV